MDADVWWMPGGWSDGWTMDGFWREKGQRMHPLKKYLSIDR